MRLLNSPVHGQAQGLLAQEAYQVQVGVKIGLGKNEDHVAVEQRVDGCNGPGQTVMTHLGHFLGLLPVRRALVAITPRVVFGSEYGWRIIP